MPNLTFPGNYIKTHIVDVENNPYGLQLSDAIIHTRDSTKSLAFAVGETKPAITIDSTSHIGIGKDPSTYNLDISGNINVTGNIYRNDKLVGIDANIIFL